MLRAGALTTVMLASLRLILPVLLPSWRFFKTVEPSPRVEWALVGADWQALCAVPDQVTPLQMVARLFWNAARNDALFMVSCAERIEEEPTAHSIAEITQRVRDAIALSAERGPSAQFRLVFVSRKGARITREVLFVSDPFPAVAE